MSPTLSESSNMWGLLRFIISLFPAARRATRELEKLELVREVEEAYHAKMMVWGSAVAVIGATVSLSALLRERARSARQAGESGTRESRLASALVLAKQEKELGQARCEVRYSSNTKRSLCDIFFEYCCSGLLWL